MKRVSGHVLAGALVLGAGTALFSACVHDDSTVFVQNVLAQQFQQNGMLCVHSNDPTQTVISSGTLDIALSLQYDAVYLLGNQMVPEANANQLQTETSIATVRGAIVRITNSQGGQLASFTRLAAATLPPSSGNVPGYAAIGRLTIVDANTLASTVDPSLGVPVAGFLTVNNAPRQAVVRLVTYVRFFGTTTGGRSFESNEFEFPVDVCYGCLIKYTNQPGPVVPNCYPGTGNTGAAQSPCILGQDLPVDCSLCQNISLCGPSVLTTAGITDGGTG